MCESNHLESLIHKEFVRGGLRNIQFTSSLTKICDSWKRRLYEKQKNKS